MDPASSTPVAPPPTITKVSSRATSLASCALVSAHSNAPSSRRRSVSASCRLFSPTEWAAQLSWPNQLVTAPVAITNWS